MEDEVAFMRAETVENIRIRRVKRERAKEKAEQNLRDKQSAQIPQDLASLLIVLQGGSSFFRARE